MKILKTNHVKDDDDMLVNKQAAPAVRLLQTLTNLPNQLSTVNYATATSLGDNCVSYHLLKNPDKYSICETTKKVSIAVQ